MFYFVVDLDFSGIFKFYFGFFCERKKENETRNACKKDEVYRRLKGQSPSCHLKESGGVYSGKVYFLGGCKRIFGWLWVVAKCFWVVLGRCGWFWLVLYFITNAHSGVDSINDI